jgi:hypothetical protein
MYKIEIQQVCPQSCETNIVITPLIDGLHFRRGIQNMQVLDMEWEMPVTAQAAATANAQPSQSATNGTATESSKGKDPEGAASPVKRDWTITQKAWWDGILAMEADPSVVRIALEMRVMGGSRILLAPQGGNDLGTCSIEVLSTLNTPPAEWEKFCQSLTDTWLSYVDASGNRLRWRPHWCKQWSFLKIEKKTAIDWMREVGYKDQIPLFRDALKKIGEAFQFTVEDLRARVGNSFLDSIIWGAPAPKVEAHVESKDKSRKKINKFKKWLKNIFK